MGLIYDLLQLYKAYLKPLKQLKTAMISYIFKIIEPIKP